MSKVLLCPITVEYFFVKEELILRPGLHSSSIASTENVCKMYAFVGSSGLSLKVNNGAFTASKCNVAKPVASRTIVPVRMSVASSLAALPSMPLAEGMSVTFPAYLAVFLGTLIPCAFLIILYIQAESRKAGEKIGRGEE